MKRDVGQNTAKIYSFPRGKYYFIKNLSNNLYLKVDKLNNNQVLAFSEIEKSDLKHIWMIQEIAEQKFQIIHPHSSLVLELVENIVCLRHDKFKNSQTFWLQRSNSSIQNNNFNVFIFRDFRQSKKCIYLEDKQIKCHEKAIFQDLCNLWKIEPIINHSQIMKTCVIENIHSGLVLEVYQSSQNQGQKIVQNLMNNRFNQRWKISRKNDFFIITSFKTELVLDIKHQKARQGNSVIQWKFKSSSNQFWVLEQHGKHIYLIRSAMDKSLMLGIKGHSLKDEAQLIITKNQKQSFWRIVGYLPE